MSRGFYFLYTYLSTKRERRLRRVTPKMKEARKTMMLTSLLAICVRGEFIVGRGNAPALHGAGDKRDNVHNRRQGHRCNT